ncbi:STAS domain-containing protein [Intrasporangium calvum]|uniref:STAS domain-containing protein n=1 Tax=Intrasporangium calvum TaxID=53358 RepID=A0ABT5GH18_9MICO|nr:STAS domain-containing protein [Intrasporangium calvum]MDC5697374.1 STAS domain-containing protein [Intrasporangium calvum]
MTLNAHRRKPARMPVQVLDGPDGHDVIIEGRLDVHTVPDIRDAIHAVIATGEGELRLHLRDAEIGDATGLGIILHLHRRATRAQRQLLLIDPSERTTRLLRGCRLDRILAARPGPGRSVSGTVAPLTA